jgi:hypothetical protein
MDKNLPDKWIRKAVSEAANNLNVDGNIIPIFDTRVTSEANSELPQHYILMTTQTNDVNRDSKCEYNWESSILLDIVTSYPIPGNPGSRVMADDILDALRNSLLGLSLDPLSNLEIISEQMVFPSDISSTTRAEIIFRKFLRLNLYLI